MPPAPRNLLNLSGVSKGFSGRSILSDISLGVSAGDRIGIVGRNGDGKSTLLRLMSGEEHPDAGTVTRGGTLHLTTVEQQDSTVPGMTAHQLLAGDRADHEWLADPIVRDVVSGLLGGPELSRLPGGRAAELSRLSGGERRRVALAAALMARPELLLLDEPTNHLDVEGVAWLARHLVERRGSLVVITHDRWFLDAVCTQTWEVESATVHQYEGGYAAYVLARAERDRQAASREARRQQLMRKELAWLRRGPPARTTKPKFRIDAANALIADEPPARDAVELLRFSTARLGKKAVEAIDVRVRRGDREVLDGVTWQVGPGDRVALVGVNGSGKTTLIRALAGTVELAGGKVDRGQTVRLGLLSQELTPVRDDLMVIEALEEVRARTTTAGGEELTASSLCDRFGFAGGRQRARVADLSGGERRRLQLMRILMDEPNVLLLDEPTNDLDIETLTGLEDLLDHWPGTLIVVSHDRYFVERVCDNVYALGIGGGIRHLPGGIDQYLEVRGDLESAPGSANAGAPSAAAGSDTAAGLSGAARQAARKDAARLERTVERLGEKELALQDAMATAATDPDRLRVLSAELAALRDELDRAESQWLALAEQLEG